MKKLFPTLSDEVKTFLWSLIPLLLLEMLLSQHISFAQASGREEGAVSQTGSPPQPTNLRAFHRTGQTFLAWTEVPGMGVKYNIYRARAPITSVAQATLIGTVDQNSSLNQRATLVEGRGQNIYYRISATEILSDTTGLLVYTVKESGTAYYAVTAEDSTGENQTITLGQNSLANGVAEVVNFPAPVFQEQRLTQGEVRDRYVFWTNWEATPLIPAMDNRPELAYNFVLRNVNTAVTQSMLIPLHGGVGNYLNALWKTSDPNEMQLNFDNPPPDLGPPPGANDFSKPLNTCWFGYNSKYLTGSPLIEGINEAYTRRRLVYLIQWVKNNFNVDPNRLYLAGNSFGGVGTVSLAFAFPNLFAAAWAQVPRLDFGERPEWDLERGLQNGIPVTDRFNSLWGTLGENIGTSVDTGMYSSTGEGVGIYDRTDQIFIARNYPRPDFPVLFVWAGKRDNTAGWHEIPRFINAMNESRHQVYLFWVNLGHGAGEQRQPWDQRFNLDDLNRYRLNQSYPAFSNLRINDNPGEGNDLIPPNFQVTGESTGTINGYLEWDLGTIVDTESEHQSTLKLNSLVDLFPDTRGIDSARVDVTPRRLQSFRVAALQTYSYLNRDSSGQIVQQGTAQADSLGLLTIRQFLVRRGGNRLIVTRQPASVDGQKDLPKEFVLYQNYPNPFNPTTEIRYQISEVSHVTLKVYDVLGREVATLVNDELASGTYDVAWNASGFASGVYFYRLTGGGRVQTKTMVILK